MSMKNIGLGILALIIVIALFVKLSALSIEGQWIAQSIVDNGTDTLNVDPTSYVLFIDEGRYSFESSFSETENGHVTRSGKSIILTPDDNPEPYRIQIQDISREHLMLEMLVDQTLRNVSMNRVTE